jgi:hypothetical protein
VKSKTLKEMRGRRELLAARDERVERDHERERARERGRERDMREREKREREERALT